jgi:transcriptional regulator with XRE-family HTH domain
LCIKRNINRAGGAAVAQYDIGNLIRRLRKQKRLTQEELAYPVIDRATLSKIENGKAMPNKQTIEVLLEKLGCYPSDFTNLYIDTETSETQRIVDELDGYFVWVMSDENNPAIAVIDGLIEKLETDGNYMRNIVNAQYVLLAKGFNALNRKENRQDIREMMLRAIKMTIPEYNENYIKDYYLSRQDRRILNIMAVLYRDEGNLDNAINIWSHLKINFENHCIDKNQMGRNYPNTILNLADCLYRAKRFAESIEICGAGEKVCKDTGFLRHLPLIIAVKAMCLCESGNKKDGGKLLRQVYHTCELFGIKDASDIVKRYLERELGLAVEQL